MLDRVQPYSLVPFLVTIFPFMDNNQLRGEMKTFQCFNPASVRSVCPEINQRENYGQQGNTIIWIQCDTRSNPNGHEYRV